MQVGETMVNVWVLVAAALFAVVLVLVVFYVARKSRATYLHRHDPLSTTSDADGTVRQGDLFANGQSRAQRLADIDMQLATGVITPHEHARARAQIVLD